MAKAKNIKKVFVLDTSVILHDHNAIHSFEEHDVAIPIPVLEELDNFKKGNDTKNFEAREFIRFLDKLSTESTLEDWIPLGGKNKGRIRIVLHSETKLQDATIVYNDNKADHQILNAALSLKESMPNYQVVLVTKDINLRLKAKALAVVAQDYQSGKINDVNKVLKGADIIKEVESDLIHEIYKNGYTEDISVLGEHPIKNQYHILQNGKSTSLAFYNGHDNRLEKVEKTYVYGIKPKNAEQTFAVNALMNNNIKLITLQGVAGTGKTLLALASAIEQRNQFNQIILARPIVPLSNRDIGFLPGDANEKINPYMQPLFDNLTYIKNQYRSGEKKYKQIEDLQTDNRMVIMPLAFIRGRSLSNVFFIVDEAQNLTPHEVKTIITRAGEGTKIVFTGDVHQIDTPYLDENSNGLSYLIDRLKGNELFAHVKLEKGERSELANLANELL
ncbi:MAG: PhoH family protein [Putridiphycobacter sp.]|nr:PhoH family protein [Putridiphycobacter sp.]